jgi:D-glycero-beta-D-manno-heptose-7-phosphate kinase
MKKVGKRPARGSTPLTPPLPRGDTPLAPPLVREEEKGGRFGRLLRLFPRVRVLVVGDLMLDQFIWGSVERISPEAPVPVVQVTAESFRLGGAANVVNNVRALGGIAAVCGVVGRDAAGRRLVRELQAVGSDVRGVPAARNEATTRKTRIIAHRQQVVRLDRDDRCGGRAAARARAFALAHLHDNDVVVVSDYGKGMITPDFLERLGDARARRPFLLVIDPKKENFPYYRSASLVTPNRDEASQASGVEIHDQPSLLEAGQVLLDRWEAEAVLITRGEEGMSLFVRGAPVRHFPTVARQVFDVTGAGDTVVATCALALGAGAGLDEAAVLANHAAGVVVGEIGTATVTVARLRDDLGKKSGVRSQKDG